MEEIEVSRGKAASARRSALSEGSSAYGAHLAQRSLPIDVDASRVLALPAKLTATREFLVKRECACGVGCVVCSCEDARPFWSRAKPGPATDGPPPGTEFVHLSGVASVTDKPYDMWDFYGPYVERVARDAFTVTLAKQPDVAFLVNHEGLSLARTQAGTLALSVSAEGLAVDAWLNPLRQDSANLITAIHDGCIDQMSIGAMLEDGIWNEEFTEFTLTRLDLHCGDVSGVNFGANPHTTLVARARRVTEQIDRMPDAAARAMWKRLDKRFRPAPDQVTRASEPVEATPPVPGRAVSLVRAALLINDD